MVLAMMNTVVLRNRKIDLLAGRGEQVWCRFEYHLLPQAPLTTGGVTDTGP